MGEVENCWRSGGISPIGGLSHIKAGPAGGRHNDFCQVEGRDRVSIMIVEDQSRVENWFADPANLGEDSPPLRIDTHISTVFLGRDKAWKLKKAVRYPYADFSTAAIRCDMCAREVALNRRTAPGLYLGVQHLHEGPDGKLSFSGRGTLVDCAVEMVRFEERDLLDRMAIDGRLDEKLAERLAGRIAAFHRECHVPDTAATGAERMDSVLDINLAGFRDSGLFDEGETARLDAAFRGALSGHARALDERAANGWVRRAHGDLHLRNICLHEGEPLLFDCIEFSEEIATVDVLYDLAFLLMDLWHRGEKRLANLVLNRWMDDTGTSGGIGLVPFFMAVRAAVRAHVEGSRASAGGDGAAQATQDARSYFALARELLDQARPRLIAIGGLSGSGKTTVSRALAPQIGNPPGARLVESDRLRKAMFGVEPDALLPDSAYVSAVSRKVYETMAAESAICLGEGATVIANAVNDREEDRSRLEEVARKADVPFAGVWLEASANILRKRVGSRAKGASDADLTVLEGQLASHRPPPTGANWLRIDAARPVDWIIKTIRASIGEGPDKSSDKSSGKSSGR